MADDPTDIPRFPSTGWHQTADGPVFAHADGAPSAMTAPRPRTWT
jgi:hypothetical protein